MKRRLATVALFGSVLAYGIRLSAQLTVPPSGVITTLAGTGYWGNSGDGGPATSATVSRPTCVVVDSAGNVYFADGYYGVIRKATRSTGIISTIVGTGTQGYSGDGGPANLAQIQSVQGMALDLAGNLYISDSARIRKVTASTGIISTIAGDGSWGYSGDGGPATSASLENNGGVAVDSAGNVYFTDEYNAVVREVWVATGIITTIAGNGTAGYTGDGGLATSAELNMPYGIAVDPAGNLYIADSGANVIRKVAWSTGKISTVAGNGTAGYVGDGSSATSAELNIPAGDVAVDLSETSTLRIQETM